MFGGGFGRRQAIVRYVEMFEVFRRDVRRVLPGRAEPKDDDVLNTALGGDARQFAARAVMIRTLDHGRDPGPV